MTIRQTVRVELGERSYDIVIGPNLLAEMGERLEGLGRPKSSSILVVTDTNVNVQGYGQQVIASLRGKGYDAHLTVVPASETSKSMARAEELHMQALEHELDRKSTIVALGGGVVGDLAGFVAATYMRGIPFIQVPTNIQAHDASVGGKVAVDLPTGKNIVGAFHQPLMVAYDTDTLKTVPARHTRSGLAEVVKHGFIRDKAFLEWLEQNMERILGLEDDVLAQTLARSCAIKAQIVAEDERETSVRALLNFGHTVGHAIEAWFGYDTYTHGEAISMGMAAAARVGEQLGYTSSAAVETVDRVLSRVGLPTRIPGHVSMNELISLLRGDKKNVGKSITFVLLNDIGQSQVVRDVPEGVVRSAITSVMEATHS